MIKMETLFDWIISLIASAIIIFLSFVVFYFFGVLFGVLTYVFGLIISIIILTKIIERHFY